MIDIYPTVHVVSGPAFEVVAELLALSSGPARASLESGRGWIRQVRKLAGKDLIARVERWAMSLYAELAAITYEIGAPFEPDRLVSRIREMPATGLRSRLLGSNSPPNRRMVSSGAFERAILGERGAQAELRNALGVTPEARAGIDRVFATGPDELRDEIASIVEAWADRVSPEFAASSRAITQRDVGPKEGLLKVTTPRDALRVFTNGVDIDPPPWAKSIVVIPVVAIRPFIVPLEWNCTLMLLVSVADDPMDAMNGSPPRRLVRVASALSDELRLCILHELGGGERTLSELAHALGVDGASLQHHLGILRSAGLLAVKAESGETWRYSVRMDSIDRVTAALNAYVTPRPTNGAAA